MINTSSIYYIHILSSAKTVTWGTSNKKRESTFKEKAKFEYDGNMTFTMTVPRVEKEDRGEYFCLADNKLASGKTHTKTSELKVNCKRLRRQQLYSSNKFIHFS